VSWFDTIPHDRLLALVTERVADGRVLALVESFLRAGVLEEVKGWQTTERGTPQGGVISPLLASLCPGLTHTKKNRRVRHFVLVLLNSVYR